MSRPEDADLRLERLRLAVVVARAEAIAALDAAGLNRSSREIFSLAPFAGARCVADWRRTLIFVERTCEDFIEVEPQPALDAAARAVRAVGLAMDDLLGALVAERWPS